MVEISNRQRDEAVRYLQALAKLMESDNRTVKRITHDELFLGGELIDIENWFNIA